MCSCAPGWSRPFPVAVGAWAIETYLYENGTLTPTNLLEEPEN